MISGTAQPPARRKGIPEMKKLFCLILVLICIGTAAMAESVPSKSTADLVETVAVTTETGVAAPDLVIAPVVDAVEYQQKVEICQNEIQKLAESASVEEYFGEVKDSEGNAVSVKEVLEAQNLTVNEFMPLVVNNYDASYGKVKVNFKLSTPYTWNEKVVVLVGIVNPVTGLVEWTMFDGIGTIDGNLEVEFTPEILAAVQSSDAMMAVASSADK